MGTGGEAVRETGRDAGHGKAVCVFCGARVGQDAAYAQAARDTAYAIADLGMRLVYGGGNIGLMGVLADAAVERGVHVTGVIPRSMVDVELAHRGVQRLMVVETMHERKAVMARESDAILVLPGGVGTLDELFEAMTWNQLKLQRKPIGLVDLRVAGGDSEPAVGDGKGEPREDGGGFYRGLLEFMGHARREGFVLDPTLDLFVVETTPVKTLARVVSMLGA